MEYGEPVKDGSSFLLLTVIVMVVVVVAVPSEALRVREYELTIS